MKKNFTRAVHSLFRISLFEKLLYPLVNGSFIGSVSSKLVPPNSTYPANTRRSVLRQGYKMELQLNDYNDWKAYWGLKEEEREVLYQLARNAKTVVDVGVNNGWVMMSLAKIVAPRGGHVYGFEPYPPTFERSNQNISRNHISNATLFNLGCGDRASEMQMATVVSTNSGQNRIISSTEDGVATKTVQVVRLDD